MYGTKDKNTEVNIKIKMAAVTDVGRVRERNEDNYFFMTMKPEEVRPTGVRAVAVVADGMGGHVGGEVASGAVVRLIGGSLLTEDGWGLSRFGDNIEDAVMNLIREADKRVKSIGQGGEKPPGTTLTAAFIIGNRAYIGHVGDSRAYLIRDKTINAVTEDHSLLGQLIREGKIDPADAKDFEGKNVITRAIGAGSSLEVDRPVMVEFHRGDILLLCSDGLWDLVSDEEILGTIHSERSLKRGVNRLVGLANEGGGDDNITVVAVEFGKLKRDRKFAESLIGLGADVDDVDDVEITKVIKVGAIKDTIDDGDNGDDGEITKVLKVGATKDTVDDGEITKVIKVDAIGDVDDGDDGDVVEDGGIVEIDDKYEIVNVTGKKSKSKLSAPTLVAIVAVGVILTILMFAGIWYGFGAVVDNYKDKEVAPEVESGIEVVIPDDGKGETGEKNDQKMRIEETEVKESQPIINLPDDQFD
jgi:PPM family protein phosphatase